MTDKISDDNPPQIKLRKFLYNDQIRVAKYDTDKFRLVSDAWEGKFKLYTIDHNENKEWTSLPNGGDDVVISGTWDNDHFKLKEVNPTLFTSPDVTCEKCGARGVQRPDGKCANCEEMDQMIKSGEMDRIWKNIFSRPNEATIQLAIKVLEIFCKQS